MAILPSVHDVYTARHAYNMSISGMLTKIPTPEILQSAYFKVQIENVLLDDT